MEQPLECVVVKLFGKTFNLSEIEENNTQMTLLYDPLCETSGTF
jgi:hypothetical protein